MPSGGDGRAISLDGYAVGPDQGPEHPLGVGGDQLHTWAFATRTFRQMFGEDGTDGADRPDESIDESIDDRFAAQGDVGIGETVMGRNMFGPIRGSWGDEQWRGWWGDDPPYHDPVFVLTHHRRAPIPMTRAARADGSGRLWVRARPQPGAPWSGDAVDGDLERGAHVAHAVVAQPAEARDEHPDRHALRRVEVDGTTPGDRIVPRLQDHLARQAPNGGRARGHEGAP